MRAHADDVIRGFRAPATLIWNGPPQKAVLYTESILRCAIGHSLDDKQYNLLY
jgi:hypothetical protein